MFDKLRNKIRNRHQPSNPTAVTPTTTGEKMTVPTITEPHSSFSSTSFVSTSPTSDDTDVLSIYETLASEQQASSRRPSIEGARSEHRSSGTRWSRAPETRRITAEIDEDTRFRAVSEPLNQMLFCDVLLTLSCRSSSTFMLKHARCTG